MAHIEVFDYKKHYDAVLSLQFREADVAEVLASTGLTPRESLELSLTDKDEAYVMLNSAKEVFGAFGVGAALPIFGTPWMLATDEILKHQKTLLRLSRKKVAEWVEQYGFLVNFVDSRNTASIKWLEWLGFEVDCHKAYCHDPEVPFYMFCQGESPDV